MYAWVIYLHIAAAILFFFAHGVSAFVGLSLRRERNPERIRALLDLSQSSLGLLYIALLVILLTGIGGGFMGNWWGRGWIWAALVVFVLVIAWMMVRGSRFYAEVRAAVGAPIYGKPPETAPKSAEEVAALLDSGRPMELMAVGIIGLLVLLYLMVFKPF